VDDIIAAFRHAVRSISFTTPPHRDRPEGWEIRWGDPDKGFDIQALTLAGDGSITDDMLSEQVASQKAGYLAKYTTKSTEATGFSSVRITDDTIGQHDPDGDHIDRLITACWRIGRPTKPTPIRGHLLDALLKQVTDKATQFSDVLGLLGALAATYVPRRLVDRPRCAPEPAGRRPFDTPWTCPDCGTHTRYQACPTCVAERQGGLDTKSASDGGSTNPYTRLRRWAHRFGFAGHFLTKTRRRVVRFATLRETRITYRRTEDRTDTNPGTVRAADHQAEETTLIVGTLTFAGVGWHNTGDALLANTAAALARARHETGREELAHEIGSGEPAHDLAAA
jgi:hypothetical protein